MPASARSLKQWKTWLAGLGTTARYVAEKDWSGTSIGPIDAWPDALRRAMSECMAAPNERVLLWGPDLLTFYNDAVVPGVGAWRHPEGIGLPPWEGWSRSWEQLKDRVTAVMCGETLPPASVERILLDRTLVDQEFFLKFRLSPIMDADARVLGVFIDRLDLTDRVLAERRLGTLVDLSNALSRGAPHDQQPVLAARVLLDNALDHPFIALLKVRHQPGESRALDVLEAGEASSDLLAAAATIATDAALARQPQHAPWHDDSVAALHAYPFVHYPAATLVLVVGHSRHRPWDNALMGYLDVAVASLAQALASTEHLDAVEERFRAAKNAEAERSAFLASISHELRTPLTLISAPLEAVLSEGDLPVNVRTQLELAERGAHRLTRLVDAVFDLSRLDTGALSPRFARVNVARLIRSLVDSFEPVATRAGLKLTASIDDLPTDADLDADMLERIVLNLLSNAVKYTARGTVLVSVQDAGERFIVAVTDTGIGIAEADQERVFRRFERLGTDADGVRSVDGGGIGLALVRSLAQAHHGEVSVASDVGRGSTFTVALPYRQQPQSTPGPNEPVPLDSPGPSLAVDAHAAHRRRLLLVEDHPDMAEFLMETLGGDYEIDHAANGRLALARLRSDPPDIVLTDVMMPDLDGYGLIDEIRADDELANLPVVMLSARASSRDAVTGLGRGADDYIAKPFSATELKARLEATLVRARARTADAAWRRALLHGLPDAVVLTDGHGKVLEVSDRFRQLLGWGVAARASEPPHPWWPDPSSEPYEFQRCRDSLAKATQGESVKGEFHLRRSDGESRWISLWATPIPAPDSGTVALVTMRDVTPEHDSRERRAEAVRVASELRSATDLGQALAIATQGFAVLFGGHPHIQVSTEAEGRPSLTCDDGGPSELIADALMRDSGSATVLDGTPQEGVLLTAHDQGPGCRTWVQFPVPRPVRGDELILGALLAQALDLAVDHILATQSFDERRANLERAIASHRLVGQAIGILVERHRITPTTAFARLRDVSQKRNLKLRDIAARVVEQGVEPDA